MPQICDMGPTALLPFRRKTCWHYSCTCTMFGLTCLPPPPDTLNNSPRHSPYRSCWHSPKRWHCASSWIPRAWQTPTQIDSSRSTSYEGVSFEQILSPTLINHAAKFPISRPTIFHWCQRTKKMSDVCHVTSDLWLVLPCDCRLPFEKLNEDSKVVSIYEFQGPHTL